VASLSLRVSPAGHLRPDPDPPAPAPLSDTAAARIVVAFQGGEGPGLLHLGAAELETALPPVLGFFRDLGRALITRLVQLAEPEQALARGEPAVDEATVAQLLLSLPPMTGAEYVDAQRLRGWWAAAREALHAEVAGKDASVEAVLRAASPLWSSVGRVHFHLAENRRGATPAEDGDGGGEAARPFAFLATYTTGLGPRGQVQHAPLGQALRQYAGARNKMALLSLLSPVERAAAQLPWVRALVDGGAIYQPLAWAPGEALALLRDAEALEQAGLVVRVPAAWGRRRPARATVQVSVGGRPPGELGAEALLDFDVSVTLDAGGDRLTAAEIEQILAGGSDLVLLRGRWIEVDRAGLSLLLERWRQAEAAHAEGLPFHEALRLLAGAGVGGEAAALLGGGGAADDDGHGAALAAGMRVVPGAWLAEVLDGLRTPEGLAEADPGAGLAAELRPYQRAGVRWLWWLRRLGLGGCLADDMGLGKTVQVIALFVLARRQRAGNGAAAPRPSLVVAPASLIANWRAELARFAPALEVLVAHTSETPLAELGAWDRARLEAADVVLTSYGTLQRLPLLRELAWDVAVVDEAQAIKNAGTKQARTVRALAARCRLALTGTPVENRLGDLWSIFAFTNPGLLGDQREFSAFVKRMEGGGADGGAGYGPLRALVQPYILRRLKSQKHVLADLPDKTEVRAFCGLSRKQSALYQQAVEALARELKAAEGIQRRGLVLSYLTRLKQICNHPSHYLRDGGWAPEDSGKLGRLGELVEEIAERQQKLLVFTQFKEMTEPLAAFLGTRFGRPGLVLSGDTAVGRRQKLVDEFQAEEGPPFFVLSLRAGGTGLNLTAASHVVHFDRWWNPAVEDQATDRAYRIGQHDNVLVHKLMCRGTLEERIDALIESKRDLSRQIVEAGDDGGGALTELSNEEILRLVSLDVRTAKAE
jgi:superfamily II DNA or RNA helicase